VTFGLARAPVGGVIFRGTSMRTNRNYTLLLASQFMSAFGDNLLLKATVDRTRVVQGEQVNIVFKIYTRVSIASYAVEKNPTMTGFWGEDVETPKNIQTNPETVNGKQFKVGVIKRMALFPTQSGALEIGPMEVQTTVQVQDRRSTDPFDSFFRDPSRSRPRRRSTGCRF